MTDADPKAVAKAEGLRYVSDAKAGISRKKQGAEFRFFAPDGSRITDEAEIKRIKAIGIPPAYERVWICPHPNGHIQATGYDAKGRKQYRYHARWRSVRDENKFQHILHFGEKLPALRLKIAEHMKLPGLPREKVLATVVQLLEKTLIRVGNSEYARKNSSYGLTTMRRKHVAIHGGEVRFKFMGKSGKQWDLSLKDRRIAAVVKRCADIPGYELFKYVAEDGSAHDVGSADVNSYLREITGEDYTAKDFRTWSGTVLAAVALREFEKYDSAAEAKKNIVRAVETVSKQLGNTPAICRKCYVHPEIFSAYLDNTLAQMAAEEIDREAETIAHYSDDELMVLAFLKRRLHQVTKAA